jgi:hypothetical protein
MQTSLEEDKRQLIETNREIKDVMNSGEYKLLAARNRAWVTPKATDQERADWAFLQERLSDLRAIREFWQDTILHSISSHARKKDSNRKEHKKKAASKSVGEFLTKIADHLYSIYRFETRFDDATFGDVMEAAQFKNRRAIVDYFSLKANNTTNADGGNIRDSLSEDEWIYLLELNFMENAELHSRLKQTDGKTTIVLPSTSFQPKLVQGLMTKMGLDIAHFDIKNADSDSSPGSSSGSSSDGSPDKKCPFC